MNGEFILSLPQNFALFAVSALVIWFAGTRLAYLVDSLSEHLKLAKSLAGLLILAVATSLPEIATTLSAAFEQRQELVLNNLYGGIALQTAVLALADFWARGSITNYPRKANHTLEGVLLVGLLSLTLVIFLLGEPIAIGPVGLGSVLIALCYAASIWLLRRYDETGDWIPVDQPESLADLPAAPLRPAETLTPRALYVQSAFASLAILVFGIGLVISAEGIAFQTGLGTGFVGVTMLAAATSLPELTTTIAAVRMGAYTMAISNIFGSNLIMLVLVFPADFLFIRGPILRDPGPTVPLAISFGMLVTAIYLVGLLVRRKPRIGVIGFDSAAVLVVFLTSLVAYYVVTTN